MAVDGPGVTRRAHTRRFQVRATYALSQTAGQIHCRTPCRTRRHWREHDSGRDMSRKVTGPEGLNTSISLSDRGDWTRESNGMPSRKRANIRRKTSMACLFPLGSPRARSHSDCHSRETRISAGRGRGERRDVHSVFVPFDGQHKLCPTIFRPFLFL